VMVRAGPCAETEEETNRRSAVRTKG